MYGLDTTPAGGAQPAQSAHYLATRHNRLQSKPMPNISWQLLYSKTRFIKSRAKSQKSIAPATIIANSLIVSTPPCAAHVPHPYQKRKLHGDKPSHKSVPQPSNVWQTQPTSVKIKKISVTRASTKHSISMYGMSCVRKSKATNNH